MTINMNITDLDHDQLKQVFQKNSQLQEAVRADSYIGATIVIGDILKHFKESLLDYNISSYGVNYLTVKRGHVAAFIAGVKEAHETYALFTDAQVTLLDTPVESISEYVEAIAMNISAHFEIVLAESITESTLFNHLVNYYIPSRIPNAYIELDEDGNSDYVLHETFVRHFNQPETTQRWLSA